VTANAEITTVKSFMKPNQRFFRQKNCSDEIKQKFKFVKGKTQKIFFATNFVKMSVLKMCGKLKCLLLGGLLFESEAGIFPRAVFTPLHFLCL
jgi:hypothetical protein